MALRPCVLCVTYFAAGGGVSALRPGQLQWRLIGDGMSMPCLMGLVGGGGGLNDGFDACALAPSGEVA